MNMSVTPPPASAACDRAGASTDAREPSDPLACDAFARALQNRQRQQDSSCPDGEEPSCEALVLPALPTPLPARAPALPAPSSAGAVDPASGTRAVIETSLRHNPCPMVTPIGGVEPALTWEATVHEPNSVAVEVRAVRAERSAASGPQVAWGLTIASPSVGVEVLARHAPRLNERLRKHAIELDHVRVERSEEDDR